MLQQPSKVTTAGHVLQARNPTFFLKKKLLAVATSRTGVFDSESSVLYDA